ncbi:hypothetical protein JCM4814A_79630 [Streptomyces phaeofaciens JCM 4814]|uniref:Uncharacterized protein n=1 Tax=Streptomyces phaeofaciens TaxID=68254 RepID=A0A918M177_9ACTN|nr:hypothetical protein GCM10010226_83010 [Streptomyces phaeofaciens]
MAEPTQTEKPPTRPDIGIALCAWHESYSNAARLVRDTSGAKLFARLPCRQAYNLAPMASNESIGPRGTSSLAPISDLGRSS